MSDLSLNAPCSDRVEVADRMAEYVERDALLRMLAELPRRQRAVLVLRYFEDLTEMQTGSRDQKEFIP